MPKLYTNEALKPVQTNTMDEQQFCVASYDEYESQRTPINNIDYGSLQQLTNLFKAQISDPLHALNPNLEMGEYFVVPVKELRELLDCVKDVAFVNIANAVRTTTNSRGTVKTFPVTILTPLVKTVEDNKPVYRIFDGPNSVFVEAYPCPPDPRCPKKSELLGTVLNSNAKLNTFNSLY